MATYDGKTKELTNGGIIVNRVMFSAVFAGAVALALTTAGCVSGQARGKTCDGFALRIHCGSEKAWIDPRGNVWQADRTFEEGKWGAVDGEMVDRGNIQIDGTDMEPIYRTEHYGMSAYKICCPPGKYNVTLHFAETYDQITAAGERVFAIAINGKEVVSDMDPVKMAGKPCKAVVKPFETEAPEGMLVIAFTEKEESPEINGIEIIRQP
jgi:hypothetical protein